MKLLGRFRKTVSNHYVGILSNHGIIAETEDEDEISSRYILGLNNSSYVKIYVSEIEYDEAFSLIKEFEQKSKNEMNEVDIKVRSWTFIVGLAVFIIVTIIILITAGK